MESNDGNLTHIFLLVCEQARNLSLVRTQQFKYGKNQITNSTPSVRALFDGESTTENANTGSCKVKAIEKPVDPSVVLVAASAHTPICVEGQTLTPSTFDTDRRAARNTAYINFFGDGRSIRERLGWDSWSRLTQETAQEEDLVELFPLCVGATSDPSRCSPISNSVLSSSPTLAALPQTSSVFTHDLRWSSIDCSGGVSEAQLSDDHIIPLIIGDKHDLLWQLREIFASLPSSCVYFAETQSKEERLFAGVSKTRQSGDGGSSSSNGSDGRNKESQIHAISQNSTCWGRLLHCLDCCVVWKLKSNKMKRKLKKKLKKSKSAAAIEHSCCNWICALQSPLSSPVSSSSLCCYAILALVFSVFLVTLSFLVIFLISVKSEKYAIAHDQHQPQAQAPSSYPSYMRGSGSTGSTATSAPDPGLRSNGTRPISNSSINMNSSNYTIPPWPDWSESPSTASEATPTLPLSTSPPPPSISGFWHDPSVLVLLAVAVLLYVIAFLCACISLGMCVLTAGSRLTQSLSH